MDHIIPVERLKEIAGDSGIPINAFPNLCLLNFNLNRSKNILTYYELIEKRFIESDITELQVKELVDKIEKFSLTSKDDLEFINNDFNTENYTKFLEKRFERILDKFYSVNNIK